MNRSLGLAAALAVSLVMAGSSSAASQETFGALIEHWDGTAWTHVPVMAGDELSAVTAVSATDVWAFGTANVSAADAVHWDGSSWQQVQMPVPEGATEVELYGAAAGSSTDVWVVGTWAGSGGVGYRSLIEHWDGTAWKLVPSPNPTLGAVQLESVAVLSATNAWAVGWYESPKTEAFRTLVLHWNGKSWTRIPSPSPADAGALHDDELYGVAAVSPRDVWAVGTYFHHGVKHPGVKRRHSYVTLVLHWDGKGWKRSPSPNPGGLGHQNALDAVAADPAGHLWASGSYRDGSGEARPLAERRGAHGWRAVPAPGPQAVAPQLALASLSPLAANDVWAAGWYQDDELDLEPRALIEHWDGHAWQVAPIPTPAPGDYEALYGIAAVSPTDVWAVGVAGSS